MKNNYIYYLFLIFSCCISAFSQILLKKASQKQYKNFIKQYINCYVIFGYCLYALVVVLNSFIIKYLSITITSALTESLPIILSFITGKVFFNEKITKNKIIGGMIIIAGIIIIMI